MTDCLHQLANGYKIRMTCVDIQRRPSVDLAESKERGREYEPRSSTRYCYHLPTLPSRERCGLTSKDPGQSAAMRS